MKNLIKLSILLAGLALNTAAARADKLVGRCVHNGEFGNNTLVVSIYSQGSGKNQKFSAQLEQSFDSSVFETRSSIKKDLSDSNVIRFFDSGLDLRINKTKKHGAGIYSGQLRGQLRATGLKTLYLADGQKAKVRSMGCSLSK